MFFTYLYVILCHKTLALSSPAKTWSYRHPCETWTDTPPCHCIRALWSECWWLRSYLADVSTAEQDGDFLPRLAWRRRRMAVVASKAAFFCRFVTFHLILGTIHSHTIHCHLLRNVFEINSALNMLELHVIPERPVTTASAYRALVIGPISEASKKR